MSVTEASQLIGLSPWTIRQAANKELIAGVREGRDWDLNEASVRAFKRIRRTKGANAPMRELMKRGVAS